MTFLRNLVRDLVDKKLWPVAVALVLALVAIPVVLGGSTPETPSADGRAPGAPVGDTGSTASAAQVAVAEPDLAAKNRAGKVRNPFKGPKAPTAKDDEADRTRADAGKAGGANDETVAMSPGKGSSGDSTRAPKDANPDSPDETVAKKPATKVKEAESEPDIDEGWVATLRFGVAGEKRKLKAVPRLAPLPSSENPVIVFLGVLDDHKTALFLVGSDADTGGDGACKPSKAECETVRMRRDQTQFFDVTQEDGSVVQYQLDLESVRERKLSPKAKAASARARKRASAARADAFATTLERIGVAVANVPGAELP